MKDEDFAVDKLRKIVDWCNWENEHHNMCFKSIADIEKAYDFCMKTKSKLLSGLTKDEAEKLSIELGYNV